jgi:hypothetical protein
MFADDDKNDMEEQEQDAEQPEEESFDAEATLLDSMPPVEKAPAEEEKKAKPPAPKKKSPPKASKKAEEEGDAWQTVASTPAQKATGPTPEKKDKPPTPPQSKADFAPTTPLEAVSAAEEGDGSGGSKVPLGDFLSNLGIKDRTMQIVVLVVAGLVVLCCACSCLGLAASAMMGN